MTEQQALAIVRQSTRHGGERPTGAARLGALATVAVAAVLIALTWANTLRAIRAARQAAEAHALTTVAAGATLAVAGFDHRLREAAALLAIKGQEAAGTAPGTTPGSIRLDLPWSGPLRRPPGARILMLGPDGTVVDAADKTLIGHPLPTAFAQAVANARRQSRPAILGPAGVSGTARGARLVLAERPAGRPGLPAGETLVMTIPVPDLLAPLVMRTLAPHSAVLLIGTRDWRIHAGVGRLDGMPRDNLAATAIPAARAGADGTASGVARLRPGAPPILFAVHRIPGQNLAVMVARTRDAELGAVAATAAELRRLAIAISALIMLAGLVVLGEIRAMVRRERRLARDRTTLAAANAALARAKQDADAKAAQLEGLLAGLPDGVIMCDDQMNLVAWNTQFAAIAGIPPSLLRAGTKFEAMVRAQAEAGEFGPVDVTAEVARRLAAYATGTAFGRLERARPDGRVIEIRREPLPRGGFISVFTDITHRKRAELAVNEARAAAEAATIAKSRFVAMVSHEIRTPLQALLNGIGLLEEAPLDPMFRELLAGMRQSGVSLLRLLGDILDVSRMEAGRLALRPERIDPRRPLEQAIGMLAPQAARQGIRIVLAIAPDVPRTIMADPERLCQVAANLLSNAVKFSRPGLVHLSVTRVAGPGLRIGVADPGPVIAPAQQAQLFQPFTRLTGATTGESGVGLGLSICRELVALMGGEIGYRAGGMEPDGTATEETEADGQAPDGQAPDGQATDAAEMGNLFWFTLPLALGAARVARPAADPATRAQARTLARPRRLRLLLAEDVSVSRLVTATMLRREGHAVTPVADGAAALAAAATDAFDLILMDLQLPVLDGFAAARAIRALQGAAGRVPIVALSGHAGAEERRACHAAGMQGLLSKPAGREALLATLARHGGLAPSAETEAGARTAGPGEVLCPSRLAELRETLAPDTLARVTEECLTELSFHLARMRAAEPGRDLAEAEAAAHAMAGLAGGYGLAGLERGVRDVLGALRARRWDDPALRGGHLEAALAGAAAEIRRAVRVAAA